MILVLKKSNFLLIGLIFILTAMLIGLNVNREWMTAAAGSPTGQKIILLDPGHGGEDPGAVSIYSGIREKDINLTVAMKTKELLEAEGFAVMMTRSEDRLEYAPGTPGYTNKRSQDLKRRKKLMDESDADAVVSIHMNKLDENKDSKWYGAQTFYPPGMWDSQKLAVTIQAALKELVDPSNVREALEKKVPKGEVPIIIFRNVKRTTVIVECGFLSNPEEEKRLATKEYQDKLAEAIKVGVVKYFSQQK